MRHQKILDPDFASLFQGMTDVHIQTEDDIELQRKALQDIERLQKELEGQSIGFSIPQNNPPPQSRPPQTPIVHHMNQPEQGIGTLQTQASRRRRVAGQTRAVTAPQNTQPRVQTPQIQAVYSQTPNITGPPIETFQQANPQQIRLRVLQNQLTNALNNKDRNSDQLKKRFTNQLSLEMEKVQKQHQNNLEQLKQWFEKKKKNLQDLRRQQDKIQSLSQTVNKHSQTVQSLSQQFSRNKNYNEELKEQELLAKQKVLEQREARLATGAQLVEQDKKRLALREQTARELDQQRHQLLKQDRKDLEKQRNRLQDLQAEIKQRFKEKKQKIIAEQQRLDILRQNLDRQDRGANQELKQREAALKQREASIIIYKTEQYTKIQNIKSSIKKEFQSIEHFKRNLSSMKSQLLRRSQAADQTLRTALFEFQQVQKLFVQLQKDKLQYESDANKIHEVSLKIGKQTQEIVELKREIDQQKERLQKIRAQELLKISNARQQKYKTQNQKKELLQKMKTYQSLRNQNSKIAIPRLNTSMEQYTPRQRLDTSRKIYTSFRADEYLKDLDKYSKARDDIQEYLSYENQDLLQSKIAYETGLTKSLLTSIRGFDTSRDFSARFEVSKPSESMLSRPLSTSFNQN